MARQIIPTAQLRGLDPHLVADAMNATRADCYAEVTPDGITCRGHASVRTGLEVITKLDRETRTITTARWAKVPVEQEIVTARGRQTRVVEEWGVKGTNLTAGQVVDAITRSGETTRVTVRDIVATQNGHTLATIDR